MSEEIKERVEYLKGEIKKAGIILGLTGVIPAAIMTVLLFLIIGLSIFKGSILVRVSAFNFIILVSYPLAYLMVKKVFGINPFEIETELQIAQHKMREEKWDRSEIKRKVKLKTIAGVLAGIILMNLFFILWIIKG